MKVRLLAPIVALFLLAGSLVVIDKPQFDNRHVIYPPTESFSDAQKYSRGIRQLTKKESERTQKVATLEPVTHEVTVSRGAPRSEVETAIYQAAQEYGLSYAPLLEIAYRESSLIPGVVNAYGYAGLFQIGEGKVERENMILGDALSEARAGAAYVVRVYGSSERALSAWDAQGFY